MTPLEQAHQFVNKLQINEFFDHMKKHGCQAPELQLLKSTFIMGKTDVFFFSSLKALATDFFDSLPQTPTNTHTIPSKDEDLLVVPFVERLTGSQAKMFIKALIASYPSEDDFVRLLRLEFDENLKTLTTKANLNDMAFDLITHYEAGGKIHFFIEKSYQANPSNPVMIAFIKSLS